MSPDSLVVSDEYGSLLLLTCWQLCVTGVFRDFGKCNSVREIEMPLIHSLIQDVIFTFC